MKRDIAFLILGGVSLLFSFFGTFPVDPAWLAILLIIYAVELIVAFVQAYVFTVLSAVYIQIAEADGH